MADGRRVPIETLQPGDLIASLQIPGLVVSASSGSSDNTAVERGRSVWHFRSSMWRSIMWPSKMPQNARLHAEMQARVESGHGSMGRRLLGAAQAAEVSASRICRSRLCQDVGN
jgi:hypothetical protein